MIRNLKVLGLALIAVLAMSAMVASAASAHTPAIFEVEEGTTTTVEGEDVGSVTLSVTGTTITCSEVSYDAHVEGASVGSVTANPSYKGCKTGIGTEAKVTGFGDWGEPEADQCDFRIYADSTADLECPAGKDVKVEAGTCTVHMGTQTGLSTVKFTTGVKDFGGGVKKHDLTLDLHITKIKANHTDGFLCPLTGSGESEAAELNGEITVWARRLPGLQPVGITWTPTVP